VSTGREKKNGFVPLFAESCPPALAVPPFPSFLTNGPGDYNVSLTGMPGLDTPCVTRCIRHAEGFDRMDLQANALRVGGGTIAPFPHPFRLSLLIPTHLLDDCMVRKGFQC